MPRSEMSTEYLGDERDSAGKTLVGIMAAKPTSEWTLLQPRKEGIYEYRPLQTTIELDHQPFTIRFTHVDIHQEFPGGRRVLREVFKLEAVDDTGPTTKLATILRIGEKNPEFSQAKALFARIPREKRQEKPEEDSYRLGLDFITALERVMN